MKVSQLIHTSCGNNNNYALRGYITYGKSVGVTDAEESEIISTMDYKLRVSYRFDADEKTIDETFPRKLAYFALSSGRYCLAQSSYVGLDCEGTRYGNFFIHAFIFDKGADILPMLFGGSLQFRRRFTKEEMMGPIAGSLPEIELKPEAGSKGKLSFEANDAFKKLMVFLRDRSYAPQDKIFVRVKQEDVNPLLALIARQLYPSGEQLPFLTYCNSEKDYLINVNLFFETEDLSGTSYMMGNFHVYRFDIVSNTVSVDVKLNGYDNEWLSLMAKDEDAAFRFQEGVKKVRQSYNIPSLLAAYAVELLIEGRYEKVGGAAKGVELYEKYLASYRPAGVADNIFMALSDEEKNNLAFLKILYPGLSEKLKEKCIIKYIDGNVNSNNNIENIVDELLNPPYGAKEDVIREVFANGHETYIAQLKDKGNLILFSLAYYRGLGEDKLNQFFLALQDSYSVLPFYKKYYAQKGYRTLARNIYSKIRGRDLSISELEVLYSLLDEENKKEIVERYFDKALTSYSSLEDMADAMVGKNPFVSEKEAVAILRSGFFNKLLKGSDNNKLLALRLSAYVGLSDKEVTDIFNSLQRKDRSMQKSIIQLAEKLPNGSFLAAAFINANIASYHSEEDALSLVNDLNKYPALQGQLLPAFFDQRVISLKRALELVQQYPSLNNDKLTILREINRNRSNPIAMKEYCERHNGEKIVKEYLDTLYQEDLSQYLTSINNAQQAIIALKNFDLNANQVTSLINIIFGAKENLESLNRNISAETFELIKEKAKATNASLPPRSREFIIYKALNSALTGDIKPLQELGYPTKSIYSGLTIQDSFLKEMFALIMKVVRAHKDKAEALHSLVSPLAVNRKLEDYLTADTYAAQPDYCMMCYECTKKYPNDQHLNPMLDNVIRRHLRTFKKEQKEGELKALRIDEKDFEKYLSKGGSGSSFTPVDVLLTIVTLGIYGIIKAVKK